MVVCYSVLGMYLFGGKFCMLADGSRECTCAEISNKLPDCVCDRKHFNNFLWATVTVFQVGVFFLLFKCACGVLGFGGFW